MSFIIEIKESLFPRIMATKRLGERFHSANQAGKNQFPTEYEAFLFFVTVTKLPLDPQ